MTMPPVPSNPAGAPRSSRRQMLLAAGVAASSGLLAQHAPVANAAHHGKKEKDADHAKRFTYCLNTSTIRGQNLSIEQEIDIAGKAGYTGIEPWLNKLNKYKDAGGSLKDLSKRIKDHGLTVESAIGFASWIVDDDEKRAKGFETAKRDMELLAELDAKRIAAPPAGTRTAVDLMKAAERYAKLLELGKKTGVTPQIEMWGGHPAIGRVSTAVYIAIEAGHPDACFLGDVYHTYKGGCDFDGLLMLGPKALGCFHMNDYPADPPRASIRDEHRVFPGDGIAPLNDILRGFASVGAYPALSLELFNRDYWKRDAMAVAKEGLTKMKQAVAKAFG